MKILYVDNDLEKQSTMLQALQGQENNLLIFDSAKEAFAYIAEEMPDVLLIRYQASDRDNCLRLARQTRQLDLLCSIVFIYDEPLIEPKQIGEILSAGANDLIQPSEYSRLAELINEAVARRQDIYKEVPPRRNLNFAWDNHRPLSLTIIELTLAALMAEKYLSFRGCYSMFRITQYLN